MRLSIEGFGHDDLVFYFFYFISFLIVAYRTDEDDGHEIHHLIIGMDYLACTVILGADAI
jgi:hypothetical protein